VKDAKEPREICADEFFIRDQFFYCFGGSLEQDRVGCPLVLTDEAAQRLWDGKGEQEMVAGELASELPIEPFAAFVVLTGGAMAISTGAIGPMELAAGVALIEGDPTSLGATGDDGIDGLAVGMRDFEGEALQILEAERSENLIDGGHGLSPP
jgi:hypothetical protein